MSCAKCGLASLTIPRYAKIASSLGWLSKNRRTFPLAPVSCERPAGQAFQHSAEPRSLALSSSRWIHTGTVTRDRYSKYDDDKPPETRVAMKSFFRGDDKDRETFLASLEFFTREDTINRRGHVDFIYSALRHMQEYGVQRDLEAYKKILDVFPKGKFIPENVFQAEFLHYPKQQFCAVDLLEQMEENAVIPDEEMGMMLKNIFGKNAVPCRKYMRMMYWMPKFKYMSPWPLPDPVPADAFELARLAMERMGSVDIQSVVRFYETKVVEDSLDDTWIVGVQSPAQQELIARVPDKGPIYVEGPFMIWLRRSPIAYFIMRCDTPSQPTELDADDISNVGVVFRREKEMLPVKSTKPSIHEQPDGVILAACATGTSSRDSLLSWVRILQETNPRLGEVPVIFTSRSPIGAVIKVDDDGNFSLKPRDGENLDIRNVRPGRGADECVDRRVQQLNTSTTDA